MKWLANLHATHHQIVAALVVLITGLAVVGVLRVEFDDDPRAAFHVANAEFDGLETFYAEFGQDDQEVYLIVDGDDLFSPSSMRALQAAYRSVKKMPEVATVVSLFDVRKRGPIPLMLVPFDTTDPERLARAKRDALSHPMAAGQFISADGKTTLFAARLAGENVAVSELGPTLAKLRTIVEHQLNPAGLQLRLAGHPSIRVDLLKTLRSEVVKFAAVSAVISGLIALAVFRRATAVLISVLGPVAGVLWTLGLMGWLGVKIDPLSVVLPTLLFVVGFTDAVHLVSDTQDNRSLGLSAADAAVKAVEHLGPACLLTALTTMAGFGSLAVARTECIQRFGLTCAGGTLVMFVAVQLVVPTLALTRLGKSLAPGGSRSGSKTFASLFSPIYERLLRHPRLVATVSVLVTAGCFVTSLQLQSDQRWTESLPDDAETVQVTKRCDLVFGGTMFAYLMVEWPADRDLRSPEVWEALRKLHAICDESTIVRGPISVLSIVEALKRPSEEPTEALKYLDRVPEPMLRRFVREDLGKAVVAMHTPDVGSARLAPEFARIEERLVQLRRELPGFELRLTGTVVVAARNVHQMIADLAWSLTIASVLVFLMMTVLFRSLLLGLLSVVPNVFPQAITAALLVWFGAPLTMTSVLTFSLCFGLSVDDTVHFLMRFCQERKRNDGPRAAILRTFQAVGGVMITTSLVLVGGFLAMLISQMPAVRTFAGLCCITLLAAIAGDLIMLPSLILCASGGKAVREEAAAHALKSPAVTSVER